MRTLTWVDIRRVRETEKDRWAKYAVRMITLLPERGVDYKVVLDRELQSRKYYCNIHNIPYPKDAALPRMEDILHEIEEENFYDVGAETEEYYWFLADNCAIAAHLIENYLAKNTGYA